MDSSWLTTDDECVKKWQEALFREAEKQRWLGKFTSKKVATSIFYENTDLSKGPGDEVTSTLVKNLVGAGVIDHNQMEGNEEEIVTFTQKTRLRIRRNAVRSDGELSIKRVLFDFRNLGRTLLGRWGGDEDDSDMLYAISGLANPAGTVARSAPSTNRKWYGGQTTAGAVTSRTDDSGIADTANHLFGSKVIEVIKRKAKLASPKIPPIRINGKDYYVMFVHPYQIKALRLDTKWLAAHNAVGTYKDTLFTGADSIWDGVVIHEWEKIQTRLGAATQNTALEAFGDPTVGGNVMPDGIQGARALFCGLDAGILAKGRRLKWVEKDFDYGMKHGICVSINGGIKKVVFDSEDNGVIIVDTAVVAD